ncbi:MAG: topoisomerase, partial [Defluviitaleaceae bacterium]|nr:topoisomerase [Defluviitaleaceae bacterium]
MGWVTKGQLDRARQIHVLEYVLRYESNNIKRVGGEYRLRDHESLAVGSKGWYWHSRDRGGKTALDFLIDVRSYRLVDAVCL